MKRILISTPLKGGLSSEYVGSLIRMFGWRQNEYHFDWAITKGTSVAMARDELAKVALDGGFYKWVQWDKDLGPKDSKQMLSMFARLISHDVDVVGAPYVGHNVNSKFHGATDSKELRPDGLMEMEQIPIGFSCVKVDALKKIMEANPWRRYKIKQTDDSVDRPDMFEFFPNGLVGDNTAEGKLNKINAILSRENQSSAFSEIRAVIDDQDYSGNYMLGEDYYFCMMARAAGVKLYIDNNLIIPHASEVLLPVPNDALLNGLLEEWRWADDAKPEEVCETVKALRKMLGANHV